MENEKIVPEEKKQDTVAVEEPKQEVKRDDPTKETVSTDDYTVEIVRDFYGKVDPFYLSNKNPEYAYRFLRDDSKSGGKNISIKTGNLLFDKGGWQICPKQHLLRLGIKENELDENGHLRRGDTILAFMPKALHEEKLAIKAKKANEVMDAVKRKVTKGDESVAGIGHPDMKGLQTGKQLGMK